MSRRGIVGSYGCSIFSFLMNSHTVFLSSCNNWHYHHQCRRVLFSSHPSQHLLLVAFWWLTFWSDLMTATTLMAESKEELKSLLMKMKKESEKVGLKLNISKTKIMASSPITLGFLHSSVGKESACNAGDPISIPGSGRFPEEGIGYPLQCSWSPLVAQSVENLPAMWETWVRSLGWEDSPGRGLGNPLQYSCLENPHGQRSLVGYSPWSCKSQTQLSD